MSRGPAYTLNCVCTLQFTNIILSMAECQSHDQSSITGGLGKVVNSNNVHFSFGSSRVNYIPHNHITVVQAGKDVSYLFVILAGFAVTGFLLWSVGSEFFLSDSPSAIFTKALKRVKADPRVSERLHTYIHTYIQHVKLL